MPTAKVTGSHNFRLKSNGGKRPWKIACNCRETVEQSEHTVNLLLPSSRKTQQSDSRSVGKQGWLSSAVEQSETLFISNGLTVGRLLNRPHTTICNNLTVGKQYRLSSTVNWTIRNCSFAVEKLESSTVYREPSNARLLESQFILVLP
jgi:hypothetical protein